MAELVIDALEMIKVRNRADQNAPAELRPRAQRFRRRKEGPPVRKAGQQVGIGEAVILRASFSARICARSRKKEQVGAIVPGRTMQEI